MSKFEEIKSQMKPILKRNGVSQSSVFGSFARGDNKQTSDIDILVRFKKDKTLMDLIGLKIELQEKLGRDVDILTYDSINPLLAKSIKSDEVKIYG